VITTQTREFIGFAGSFYHYQIDTEELYIYILYSLIGNLIVADDIWGRARIRALAPDDRGDRYGKCFQAPENGGNRYGKSFESFN
jgi:hypothetical protein